MPAPAQFGSIACCHSFYELRQCPVLCLQDTTSLFHILHPRCNIAESSSLCLNISIVRIDSRILFCKRSIQENEFDIILILAVFQICNTLSEIASAIPSLVSIRCPIEHGLGHHDGYRDHTGGDSIKENLLGFHLILDFKKTCCDERFGVSSLSGLAPMER